MTKENFSQAINGIDLDLAAEAINRKKDNSKPKIMRYAAAVAAVTVALSALLFAYRKLPFFIRTEQGGSGYYQTAAHKKVTVKGIGFTSDEIKDYVEQNRSTIAFGVAAQYGDTSDIKVCVKGYCHASLGKKNTVDRDFLTLPIFQNDKIVASMVIYRIDGKISNTIQVGGDSWQRLNEVFDENPNRPLVFASSGGVLEVVITPENNIYETMLGGKELLDEGEDWYALLKTEYNTFSSEYFTDESNFVIISNVSLPATEDRPVQTETLPSNKATAATTQIPLTSTQSEVVGETLGAYNGEINSISVIAEFRESMGVPPTEVSDEKIEAFSKNLGRMSLRETTFYDDFTGGGYNLYVSYKDGKSEKYVVLTDDIVSLNGRFYKDSSGAVGDMVRDIAKILG